MSEILDYKCPCCGGNINFDSTLQKMKCPYCDTEFDVDTLKSYDEALKSDTPDSDDWSFSEKTPWTSDGDNNVSVFVCNSCGGEIIGDASTAATSCPYCDSSVVMAGRLSGDLKPDIVIPFKLDKAAAKAGLKKHLSGKKLLPKIFKDENHLDEIKGIYVPFWLFSADADASIRYRGTRIRSFSDSKYIYTETSHYAIVRQGGLSFENVPADGSSKMPDDLMQSIEPFDLNEAVDFQTAYLSGYLADRYDVKADETYKYVNDRIKNSTEEEFRSTVNGYSSVITENSSIHLTKGKTTYALLPVWLLNTSWKGNRYVFAMNGQTGKFVGNLPCDKKAFWLWLLGLTGITSAVIFGILALISLF